jgi:hypothetical protein
LNSRRKSIEKQRSRGRWVGQSIDFQSRGRDKSIEKQSPRGRWAGQRRKSPEKRPDKRLQRPEKRLQSPREEATEVFNFPKEDPSWKKLNRGRQV